MALPASEAMTAEVPKGGHEENFQVEPAKEDDMDEKKSGRPDLLWWVLTGALVLASVVITYLMSKGSGGGVVLDTLRNCGLAKGDKQLLLISSRNLGDNTITQLDELVRALPSDGLHGLRVPEPLLYKNLNLLTLHDPLMLEHDFWNYVDTHRALEKRLSGLKQSIEDLDDDVMEDIRYYMFHPETPPEHEFTGLLGISWADGTESLSIMGQLMSVDDFKTMMQISHGTVKPLQGWKAGLEGKARKDGTLLTLIAKINKARVIAVPDGNPDLMMFALTAFPAVAAALTARISSGEAVYLGNGAGAMITSAMATFTNRPTQPMFRELLGSEPKGLAWLPECIVERNYPVDSEVESWAVEVYSGKKVLRLPDDVAFSCKKGQCQMLDSDGAHCCTQDKKLVLHAEDHLTAFLRAAGVPVGGGTEK